MVRLSSIVIIGVATLVVALCCGRYSLSIRQVLSALSAPSWLGHPKGIADIVIWDARLPRVAAAILVGAALGCAGNTYQAVFRNPLVSPDLMGVLSGSAFGAALMIVLGMPLAMVQSGAFVGGLIAVGVGLMVASLLPEGGLLTLLLGGLIANAIFTALLSLVKYLADPLDQLPAVIDWLLGSLASSHWSQLALLAPPVVVLLALLIWKAPLLDVLTLSDDEAQSLGVPVKRTRWFFILLATLLSSLTISMAGIIGWVGLLVPHIARLLIGAEHRLTMPLCAFLGAIGMILADTLARSISSGEVPLGIITELVGALAFVIVLQRAQGSWK